MKRHAISLATGIAIGLIGAVAAQAAGRPLNPQDFYRIQEVSDLQVSPDGKQIAYLVSHNDKEADEIQTNLWMVAWDGGEPIQLTHGTQDVSSPKFSPDGRFLSFLS